MTIQQSRSRHDAGYLFCLGQGRASAAASHWLPICWPMRSRAPLRPGARPWCAAVTSSLPVGSWRSCVPPAAPASCRAAHMTAIVAKHAPARAPLALGHGRNRASDLAAVASPLLA